MYYLVVVNDVFMTTGLFPNDTLSFLSVYTYIHQHELHMNKMVSLMTQCFCATCTNTDRHNFLINSLGKNVSPHNNNFLYCQDITTRYVSK